MDACACRRSGLTGVYWCDCWKKQKDGFSTFKSNISAFFKKSSAGQSSNIPKYPAAASDEVISETRSYVHKQAAAEGGCRQSFLRKLLMCPCPWARTCTFYFRETHQPRHGVHVIHCNFFFFFFVTVAHIHALTCAILSIPSFFFLYLRQEL